jgi:hypothetical protein
MSPKHIKGLSNRFSAKNYPTVRGENAYEKEIAFLMVHSVHVVVRRFAHPARTKLWLRVRYEQTHQRPTARQHLGLLH